MNLQDKRLGLAEQTLFMFSATVTAEELYMQGLGKTKL